MSKYKNVKQFHTLILRYENISLEEIEATHTVLCEEDFVGYTVMNKLTGFSTLDCMVCKGFKCRACVYDFECVSNRSRDTYRAIGNAYSPETLLQACRNRAVYMRSLLTEKGLSQPEEVNHETLGDS